MFGDRFKEARGPEGGKALGVLFHFLLTIFRTSGSLVLGVLYEGWLSLRVYLNNRQLGGNILMNLYSR